MNKKSHPKFVVPNFGAPNRKRVKERWRKQRGIDNKKRVKRSGYGAVPNIGYKNPESIRNIRADGTKGVLVRNQKDLESMQGVPGVSIILAHGLSTRKKIMLQKIASQKGLNIVNKVRE